ncbi:hypothetical protein [Owenweeksia hongkongensis]|uniref:hypothetical protein n=1 Tax=Owenweeksia hongkongensis TaxID=253245 RepID=UPI003A92D0EA
MKAYPHFKSFRVIILGVLVALGFQSVAQSPHSEVTLSAGINQVSLDYGFLFGQTRRHIVELGLVLGDATTENPGVLSEVDGYDGGSLLYHYVLNSNDKLNFSVGVGYQGGVEDLKGYISIPLTFRYKFDEHFRLRARLTSLLGGAEDVKVMPAIGFGVAF